MAINVVQEQYNSMSYFYNVLYSGCDMKGYKDDFIKFIGIYSLNPPTLVGE